MSVVAAEDRSSLRVDRSPMLCNETGGSDGSGVSTDHRHVVARPDVQAECGSGRGTGGSRGQRGGVGVDRRAEPPFGGAQPEEILTWAVQRYFPRFTMATGLGPEGCVIISMLAKIEPRVYIFNLDTGYQFRETLELRERMNEKYGIDIDLQRPELSVLDYERLHGGPVYARDPDRCCHDRKIAVLHRVAVNYDAWATGIRRDQSPTRADTPIVKWDKKFGLVKVSPWPAGRRKTFGSESRGAGSLQSAARSGLSEHRLPALHPRRATG